MFDTKDILVYESGNGGEISVQNSDIELAEQLYQQAYLCLFGGNVLASTRGDEIAGELRNDWWGNALFFGATEIKQFNSETERALNENNLNSAGRLSIIRAVENDLSVLKSITDVIVGVQLTSVNQVVINIKLSQPQNQIGASLQLIWDNAKKELIINKKI